MAIVTIILSILVIISTLIIRHKLIQITNETNKQICKYFPVKMVYDEIEDRNTHHYSFTEHAKQRMKERCISFKYVKMAIKYGSTKENKFTLTLDNIPADKYKALTTRELKTYSKILPLIVVVDKNNLTKVTTVYSGKYGK